MRREAIVRAQRSGLVLLTSLALGTSVLFVRAGLREISPLMLVMMRLAVATLCYAITLILLRRRFYPPGNKWIGIGVVGITNMGIPLVAFTLALLYISSGTLTVFLALIPLFTSLMAHHWLAQEKLNPRKSLGLGVALAGVTLLLATGTTGLAESVDRPDLRGHALALVGALSTAFAAVYARGNLEQVDVLVLAGGQIAIGLLFVMPVALVLDRFELAGVTWRGWLAVVYSGVIGTFIAFLLFFLMIRRFGATTAVLPGYVVPVVSISMGALFLGELVNGSLLAGAATILFGVYLASRG